MCNNISDSTRPLCDYVSLNIPLHSIIDSDNNNEFWIDYVKESFVFHFPTDYSIKPVVLSAVLCGRESCSLT
jgi:hypothetical protein